MLRRFLHWLLCLERRELLVIYKRRGCRGLRVKGELSDLFFEKKTNEDNEEEEVSTAELDVICEKIANFCKAERAVKELKRTIHADPR